MKPTIITYGIIGVGHIGNYHIQQTLKISSFNLLGIYDTNFQLAKERETEYLVKAYIKLEKLLQQCDAVAIATPASEHFKIAMLALENGCHVFIEKPITTKLEDAQVLLKAAKTKNLYVQVGHIERFNPVVATYIKNMNNNPEFMEIHRLTPFNQRGNDIDVILDLMIHDIDLVLYFKKQKIVDIQAKGVKVLTNSCDIANVRLKFEDGSVANITASRISDAPMRKIRIFENKNYIALDLQKHRITEYVVSPLSKTNHQNIIFKNQDEMIRKNHFSIDPKNALFEELVMFSKSILHNTTSIVDTNAAITALEIALLIQNKINEQKT